MDYKQSEWYQHEATDAEKAKVDAAVSFYAKYGAEVSKLVKAAVDSFVSVILDGHDEGDVDRHGISHDYWSLASKKVQAEVDAANDQFDLSQLAREKSYFGDFLQAVESAVRSSRKPASPPKEQAEDKSAAAALVAKLLNE